MQLSKSQKEAVTHAGGPAMVLAGPGSGKTLVITSRTKYLIEELKISPEEILVITFTRAAAQEMQARFQKMCGTKRYRVSFGTFHSVFFMILRHAYRYSAQNILREDQKYQILQEVIHLYHLDYEDEKELIASLTAEISMVKNEQIPLEHYYSSVCPDETFREIYKTFQKRVQGQGMLDFDDMLVYTWQLFRERRDILAMWQKHFRYILIDEFQDINYLQYEIVKMLAEPENNLFAVGDDDQSIYRFRGAKPEIMLNFRKDYPNARVIVLEDNFRSDGCIVRASMRVIGKNKTRYQKQIHWTKDDGSKVEIRCMKTPDSEALYILKYLRDHLSSQEKNTEPEFAILTRTNTGGRYIAEKLMEFNIPFEMKDQIPNLYDHWIAKDIFAYIRLSQGTGDRRSLLLIMNRPLRYISRECVEGADMESGIRPAFLRMRHYYEDKLWMVRRIEKFEDDLVMMKNMQPFAAVNWIRRGIDYDSFIRDYAARRKMNVDDLFEILDELEEAARPFKTFQEWFDHTEEYRRKLEEQKSSGRMEEQRQRAAVVLSTFHASKGLEFDEVFLPDVNDGIIPHRKAVLDTDIEEERRLLYVGMTRAKKKLHIFYTKERFGKKQEPSRFLEVFPLPAGK